MPLDRNRPYGQILPPEDGKAYEQDGHFFNAHGLQLDNKGRVVEEPVPTELPADVAIPLGAVRELIAEADKMPIAKFMIKAALALKTEPPSSKKDTIKALKALIQALEEAAKPPEPVPDPNNIDLGAWGRGEEKALFSDVCRLIRERLHRDVSTKADAIEALIDAGMLDPHRALKV